MVMDTNPTPTILPTVTIVDQNTNRPVIWNIDHAVEAGPNVTRLYGWTHALMISRPKGRRIYAIDAEIIGDVIVRHNAPRKVM